MKTISAIVLFLLLTSAIVPEIKRIQANTPKFELYNEPYYIHKKKMEIEQLKFKIIIVLKEVEINNTK